MRALFETIEQCLPEGGQWCSLEKAQHLAALVVGLRPRVIVELGVWMGGSAIPMLLALRHNRAGQLHAIDAWDAAASVEGASGDNEAWWRQVDHEKAYQTFLERVRKHEVEAYCQVQRRRSCDATVPDAIDLLHVDGNHGEVAIGDVERFGPRVKIGGIAVLDDIDWTGGHVSRAHNVATRLGFVDLYPLGTGVVMQRIRSGS